MKRAVLLLSLVPLYAAAEPDEYRLVIKDHRFEPSQLKVPAGRKVKLLVDNRDATPEEFESHALNREKIVPGNGRATLFVGPLEPGRYPFFGEFNESTAKGEIVVD